MTWLDELNQPALTILPPASWGEWDSLRPPLPVVTKIAIVQTVVARFYQIPLAEILSSRRTMKVAYARMVGMFLAVEALRAGHRATYQEIGEAFNRVHATCMHAHTEIASLMSIYPEINREVTALKAEVTTTLAKYA